MSNKIRPIAIYLPQYHPIAENDEWWGKGFTEWTNVAKAKPLFKGHEQPNLPGELGFYDLRVPEVREQQAVLAHEHGIEGFMYWHYWFAGRRILERPFQEVLESGKPDFPFCLGWANHTWSGVWEGTSQNKTLIEQTYQGIEDYKAHFYSILPAFRDKRYITINEKPLFLIYRPFGVPDIEIFIKTWKELAQKEKLKGICFVGFCNCDIAEEEKILNMGFDSVTPIELQMHMGEVINSKYRYRIKRKLNKLGYYKKYTKFGILKYADFTAQIRKNMSKLSIHSAYPMLLPNWDNSPRAGKNSLILKDSTPELWRMHIKDTFNLVKDKPLEHRIVFIKSWNEWAEGNYLEPDRKYGRKYLEILKEEIDKL